MKKIIWILLAAASLVACKKNQVTTPSVITGRWELRAMSGGFKDTLSAAGNGMIYQFNSDYTFKHFTKGVQDGQGTYQYKKGAYPFSGYNYDALILNNEPGELATINGNKLSIGTSVADGPEWDFQKIAD
jgi:hypothetical protein